MKHLPFSQIVIVILILLLNQPVLADITRSWEVAGKYDASKDKITSILKKLDQDLNPDPESEGFKFRLNTGFWSPFNYDLFLGTLSEDNPLTIIRLEGDTGDVQTLSRIFEQENIFKEGVRTIPTSQNEQKPVKLSEKSHAISQGLNLLAPWLSVLHASWNSPRLSTGQTVFRFSAYLLFDGLMVWAGGTGLWQEPFNSKKYAGSIAAALALPRLMGAMQHANLVRGHNRIARLGYTFYLD